MMRCLEWRKHQIIILLKYRGGRGFIMRFPFKSYNPRLLESFPFLRAMHPYSPKFPDIDLTSRGNKKTFDKQLK